MDQRQASGTYMCPHCGEMFDWLNSDGLIITHDWPRPCRQVCPGSGQISRNPETDCRPLWKDERENKSENENAVAVVSKHAFASNQSADAFPVAAVTLEHVYEAMRWAQGKASLPLSLGRRTYKQHSFDCGTTCCIWGAASLIAGNPRPPKEHFAAAQLHAWASGGYWPYRLIAGLLLQANPILSALESLLSRLKTLKYTQPVDRYLVQSWAHDCLAGLDLSGSLLVGADLRGACLSGVDLSYSTLPKANLANASLVRTSLEHAELTDAILHGVKASGASFSSASAYGANFTDAVLDNTNFRFADLRAAHFDRAEISGAVFRNTRITFAGIEPPALELMASSVKMEQVACQTRSNK